MTRRCSTSPFCPQCHLEPRTNPHCQYCGAQLIPNPGTEEALAAGCRCPVLDNRHGLGGFDLPDGMFWFNEQCPLHGSSA